MTFRFKLSAVAAALAAVSGGAQAIDFDAGDVHVKLGGIVNAYYTDARCTGDQAVGGLALGTAALGCNGRESSTTIGNGLLPNALSLSAKMKQDGIDVGATVLIAYAVSNSSQVGNNSNVDVRQGFMTLGTDEVGTFKIGRDWGLFGFDAIINDITLLGTGVPTKATQLNRVTLGHIGAGYTYPGLYGQIAYQTPSAAGLTADVAVLSPVDDNNPLSATNATHYEGGRRPQLQAKISYALPEKVGKVWVAGKYQRLVVAADSLAPYGSYYSTTGIEAGTSLSFGGFGLMGNVQTGHAMGILQEGDSGNAKQLNYIVQATYTIDKVKLGVNYGQNRLRDNLGGLGTDLKTNENLTAGIYYSLTKSVTLVGEASETRSHSFGDNRANLRGLSAGAILFF